MAHSDDVRRLFEAATRRDLETFVGRTFHHVSPMQTLSEGWYLSAITYQLDRCRRGEIRRLIITMPPRYLKSICASVAFPAFLLGHDPTNRIICVSYSAELSAKHARDCRSVIGSPWYQRVFPQTRLSAERNAGLDFMTKARGFRLSTSVGGTLTGRGGNVVIVDDAMKPEDAFSDVRRVGVAD